MKELATPRSPIHMQESYTQEPIESSSDVRKSSV